MAMRGGEVTLTTILVSLFLSATTTEGQLVVGYYNKICPQVESIVRDEVTKAVRFNAGVAAGLLRLHFHDCFVRGCDASVLIDSVSGNTAEKAASPNLSLRGFEVIDKAKLRLEAVCKRNVSCADILAFAARDSVALAGGLSYAVPAGRRDGRISRASETTDLPPSNLTLPQLIQFFARKGLSQDDMITLSGAHTIGRSHCSSFSKRLYNYNSTVKQDPSMEKNYANQLKQACPSNNPSPVVPLDPRSPNTFDSIYYNNVVANRGLLKTDVALLSSSASAARVKQYVANPNLFLRNFVRSMVKMGQVGVLTGRNGEIRLNCRKIN
ncbi:peroxidase 5-like [Typha angustifolia]|uniref:peroxidase 5-like n=1 Tax=Typha angustifolia TaxID=59011 RepID=UPI003C2EA4F7